MELKPLMKFSCLLLNVSFCLAVFSVFYLPVFADPEMPPPPVMTTTYNQGYYFEGCDSGKKSVLYCPRPITQITMACQYGSCWISSTQAVCGISYSGSWAFGNWVPLDTSKWYCPNARKLAELYTPIPSSLSFNGLSMGGTYSNSILRSGEMTDFSFSAYVPACLNRIPMLRLAVELKNSTLGIASKEYGLYVKHKTLDYLNENHGVIEDFTIPNQGAFRQTYLLESRLDGYVGWAWRKQFTDAVEIISNKSGGNSKKWMTFSGEVPLTAKRVGDIYFSSDFVAGESVEGAQVTDCTMNVNSNTVCTMSLLDIGKISGGTICDRDDLNYYYSSKGLTSDLKGVLAKRCGIGSTANILGIKVLDKSYDAWNFEPLKNTKYKDYPNKTHYEDVKTENVFNMTYDEFRQYAQSKSNEQAIIDKLRQDNILKDQDFKYMLDNYLDVVYKHGNCMSYNQPFSVKSISITSVNNISETEARIWMSVELIVPVKFLADVSINTSFNYNCSQSWSWGNFSELNSTYLARCMYNWDLCFGTNRSTGMGMVSELAAAGYGPMEATPTLEKNVSGILSDGRLSQERQSRSISVYRSCGYKDAWIAPQTQGDNVLLYACPIEAYLSKGGESMDLEYIGKQMVDDSYLFDYSEGQQYMVLKCNKAPSTDELGFVEKALLGSFVNIGLTSDGRKMLYKCTEQGWIPWVGICTDPSCCDPSDPDCPVIKCVDPSDPGCALVNCTDPKDPKCSFKCTDPLDPACQRIIETLEMFTVNPPISNVPVGQGGFDLWNINLLNNENFSSDVELIMTCNSQPYVLNWVGFSNGTQDCGSGCKKKGISLPKKETWDLYRATHEGIFLSKAERVGSYDFEFIVKEKATGKELYRKKAVLNVFSDSVGSPSIFGPALIFALAVALVILYSRSPKKLGKTVDKAKKTVGKKAAKRG